MKIIKIICKKSFHTWNGKYYQEGEIYYYKKEDFKYNNRPHSEYAVYINIRCYYADLLWYLNDNTERMEFLDNFYTEKEYRKHKLDKINAQI